MVASVRMNSFSFLHSSCQLEFISSKLPVFGFIPQLDSSFPYLEAKYSAESNSSFLGCYSTSGVFFFMFPYNFSSWLESRSKCLGQLVPLKSRSLSRALAEEAEVFSFSSSSPISDRFNDCSEASSTYKALLLSISCSSISHTSSWKMQLPWSYS